MCTGRDGDASSHTLKPSPSLANGTFSLWSQLLQCLRRIMKFTKKSHLVCQAMQSQVPVLSENHTLAFIDCIMACMEMVSH